MATDSATDVHAQLVATRSTRVARHGGRVAIALRRYVRDGGGAGAPLAPAKVIGTVSTP